MDGVNATWYVRAMMYKVRTQVVKPAICRLARYARLGSLHAEYDIPSSLLCLSV